MTFFNVAGCFVPGRFVPLFLKSESFFIQIHPFNVKNVRPFRISQRRRAHTPPPPFNREACRATMAFAPYVTLCNKNRGEGALKEKGAGAGG